MKYFVFAASKSYTAMWPLARKVEEINDYNKIMIQ